MRSQKRRVRARHASTRLSLSAIAIFSIGCAAREVHLDGDDGPWDPSTGRPGTAPDVTVVVADQETMMRVAVDDTRVYWLSILGDFRARVRSCLKDDCLSTIITYQESPDAPILPGHNYFPRYLLAVGGDNVYWTRPAASGVAVLTCPSAGCDGAPKLVADKIDLTSMAVDETHPYWASSSDTAILRRPLTGSGGAEAIALNQAYPGQVRIGATHAYWPSSGTVRRVTKQGGPAEELGGGVIGDLAPPLALDSHFFYWWYSRSPGTSGGGGGVGWDPSSAFIFGPGHTRVAGVRCKGGPSRRHFRWRLVESQLDPGCHRARRLDCHRGPGHGHEDRRR